MSEKVYKKISVVGISRESYEKAIQHAITETSTTIHGLSWFEVKELRGAILPDGAVEYQATIEIGFRVER